MCGCGGGCPWWVNVPLTICHLRIQLLKHAMKVFDLSFKKRNVVYNFY